MRPRNFSSSAITNAKRHADLLLEQSRRPGGKIAFIENKKPDLEYVAALLAQCERCNQWANRGPLYWALAEAYQAHMNLCPDFAVTPCANGGIALEALARFHCVRAGRSLRWIGSAFSFSNLGRGWFASMRFIDCDEHGMLDLAALKETDPGTYDGFIVTNIFGLWSDFKPYIEFARSAGKYMLIDNAAGIGERIPEWPYQSFSLHHTKPYGAGEGGLIVSLQNEADQIYGLLDYGEIEEASRGQWFNNGKISDIACAFHLDRLARYSDWAPRYHEQAARVNSIAAQVGLKRLIPVDCECPATSVPFVASSVVSLERLRESKKLHFGKYYNPLAETLNATTAYRNLVNVPTHPGVAGLTDGELRNELETYVFGHQQS